MYTHRSSDLKPFIWLKMPLRIAIIVNFFLLHMVEGWQPVHVSISVAALLFPATFGESVGSSCGPAAQEALSRHLSTPGMHPCWGKSSLYLYAFRTNQTRKRVFFNKFYDFCRFGSPCCKFHPERAAPGFWVAKWWQKWWQIIKNDDSFS